MAGEDAQRRRVEYERRQRILDSTRENRRVREEQRWSSMESAEKADEEKWNALRGVSKNNSSSVAYDVVTQQPRSSTDQEVMKREQERAIVVFLVS